MTRLSVVLLVLVLVLLGSARVYGQVKPGPGCPCVYLPLVQRGAFEVGPVRPGSPTPTATPIVPPPREG